MPDSTFVAFLTATGNTEIIFAWLRPEMLASSVLWAGVPHWPNWHVAVGTWVDKTPWSRDTRGFQNHTLSKLGFKIGSELLNFALAGLTDESRIELELQFEVIVGAAEEHKEREEDDEPEMHIVTATRQQST